MFQSIIIQSCQNVFPGLYQHLAMRINVFLKDTNNAFSKAQTKTVSF